ncbi:MAG TPA: helical backbone metal receptor [Ramlibacter sp.]|nr:helical backbone metal receptor [Ramlibacter sp.]
MHKRLRLLLALCAWLAWGQAAAALAVTDDRGISVALPAPPRRVVSLVPVATEIVCELGACARLVGVDDYSNWPPETQRLPHVGGLEDANVERIVALKPDIVLLAMASRVGQRLQALGIPVLALETKTLQDMGRVTGTLAAVLGLPDAPGAAAALLQRIDEGVNQAAASVARERRGQTVYFEVSSGPYAASEQSFIGQTLARLGAVNVVPGSLGPFPKLNPEFVVRADPQVIFISARSAADLATRPGWPAIRALRDRRVCSFDAAQGDMLVRPGPRMVQAAQLMARCLNAGAAPAAAR